MTLGLNKDGVRIEKLKNEKWRKGIEKKQKIIRDNIPSHLQKKIKNCRMRGVFFFQILEMLAKAHLEPTKTRKGRTTREESALR